ncbi:hypothetical protein M8J77_016157 [Diaphorina citri]|nr:hypothetical protein M8J77_016157 [Diaphorina citri]
MSCGICNKNLPSEAGELDYTRCAQCNRCYHFDCCKLKFSSWKSMGATRCSEWICLRCRKTNPPADGNISDEDEEEETGQDVGKMLKEMAKKWDGFEKKVSKKLDDFEANLNFYGEKVEQSCTTLKNLEQKLIAMEKRIDKTETENRELKTRLRTLEIQIQENTQKDFMNMMEISGIQNKEADPKVVTNIILEKAGYQPNEIKTKVEKVTKKVGEDKKEKTVITVKFESQEVRNEVLTKIKRNKVWSKLENTINSDKSFLIINESLSPYYKKLFFEARKVKIEKDYKYLWVQNGNILFKKTENARIMRLSCMDDLGKI